MYKKAVTINRFQNNFNRGDFLSAKIYSDVKGNKCACGGSFTERQTFKECEFPICYKCKNDPPLYRIVANLVDGNGINQRVTLRYDQEGNRLKESIDVLYCLKNIKAEISNGIFVADKYISKSKKEGFLFENFAKEYLDFHTKRLEKGEITPSGLRNKKNFTLNHLLPYFKGVDISFIRQVHIEKFKLNYNGSDSMLNHSLTELRTILKFAHRFERINSIPYFGKIKKTKKRIKTMDMATAKKIISKLENETYKNICIILTQYPVRPGEVRALRWEDIDFKNNTITFDEHFSDEKLTGGRKSRKEGEEYSSLTLPITTKAMEILSMLPRSLKKDSFVFKGGVNDFVSSTALNRAWSKAREKAGFQKTNEMKYDLYEIKHALLSKLNSKAKGNLKTLEKASGVSSKTLMERYVYDHQDLDRFFQ